MNIKSYVYAATPAIAVETVEEERFLEVLQGEFPKRRIFLISQSNVLKDIEGRVIDDKSSFTKAFTFLISQEKSLLVVLDWQHLCRNAMAYRALKDQLPILKSIQSSTILVAPSWSLPPELEHDIPVLQMPLPTREQLRAAFRVAADSRDQEIDPLVEEACVDAAAGLTLQEAENSITLNMVENLGFNPSRIEEEKKRLIRQSGYLEVWTQEDLSSVGGLEEYKVFLREEVLPNKNDLDLMVRGILFYGIPGTGKSLSAKATASMLGWICLKMDISSLMEGVVGGSERKMREAIKLAKAFSPCVVVIDEMEKGLGGYASSAKTEGGVTLRMLGTLLIEMQEAREQILWVGTCNDQAKLPQELIRRFDETFFVDLPTKEERDEIAKIHLRKIGCAEGFSGDIAELTDQWTGAEIQKLAKSAARRSQRNLSNKVLTECAMDIKPISQVRRDEIQEMRAWANNNLRLANRQERPAIAKGRRVEHAR